MQTAASGEEGSFAAAGLGRRGKLHSRGPRAKRETSYPHSRATRAAFRSHLRGRGRRRPLRGLERCMPLHSIRNPKLPVARPGNAKLPLHLGAFATPGNLKKFSLHLGASHTARLGIPNYAHPPPLPQRTWTVSTVPLGRFRTSCALGTPNLPPPHMDAFARRAPREPQIPPPHLGAFVRCAATERHIFPSGNPKFPTTVGFFSLAAQKPQIFPPGDPQIPPHT
jgi:hypothetical protein